MTAVQEGVHDPHIFKAIFMAGAPGSGKTFIASKVIGGTGLKPVNIDQLVEFLASKRSINLTVPHTGPEYDQLYKHSYVKNRVKQDLLIEGRIGLLIDGTGRNVSRIADAKGEVEAVGYDSMMIFVNTTLETSLARNQQRSRIVDPDYLRKTWHESQKNIGAFNALFGSNFVIIDNNDGEPNLAYLNKHVRQFLNAPPRNKIAVQWIAQQKSKHA